MHTLQHHLTTFFASLRRPALGRVFMQEYAALHPDLARKLTLPFEGPVSMQSVANMLGLLPVGRAVSITELEFVDGEHPADGRRPLTESALTWLLYRRDSPGAQVATMLARLVLREPSTDALSSANLRMERALINAAVSWAWDYGGLARAARLLSAERGAPEVAPNCLASAALLLMARPAWEAIASVFPPDSTEWKTLVAAYVQLRSQLVHAHQWHVDKLLAAALFARDLLLPIPMSGRLADLRMTATALGFAWPGARSAADAGPLDSSPLPLDDTAFLSHVLLPTLTAVGIVIPWSEPAVRRGLFRQVVGLTPSDGGWPDLLLRVIERYEFGSVIERAGYEVSDVVTLACTGRRGATIPAASVATPAARSVAPAARSVAPAAGRDAPAARPSSPGHYHDIVSAIRAQGIQGHDAIVRELALLADDPLADAGGARVLLIGPSGTGKTSLLAALAAATGRPYVRVDASSISEHGYSGLQLADVAAMVYRAAGRDMTRAERAVVTLDEFCKCTLWPALPGAPADVPRGAGELHGASVRAGRQGALLALLDNGPSLITFSPEPNEPLIQLRTRDLMIVCAGVFAGLEMDGPTPTDHELQKFGIIDELTARLLHRLVLQPLSALELEHLWATGTDGVSPITAMAARFGYTLTVAPEAIRVVAQATVAGRGGLTPRTGAGVLQAAARRALLQALEDPNRTDTVLQLGPDEVLHALRP